MENVELISPEYEASLTFLNRTLTASGWRHEDIERTINEIRKQTASRAPATRKR